MPEIVNCSDCGRKLRVPDNLLGRKVKCPGCGVQFTANPPADEPPPLPRNIATEPRRTPRPPAPREEDEEPPRSVRRKRVDREEDDEPPRRRRAQEYDDDEDRADAPRSLRESWEKVRLGISFVIISIWVFLGGIFFGCLGGMFVGGMGLSALAQQSQSALNNTGNSLLVVVIFGQVIGLVSTGFKVAGHAFGMAVPPKRNNPVRGLAIATFILAASQAALLLVSDIISLIVGADALNGNFSPMALTGNNTTGILGILSSLVAIAWLIVFLFYLRNLCLAVRKDGMASTVTTYMISVGGFIALSIVLVVMMVFLMGVSFNMFASGNVSGASNAAQGMGFLAMGLTCVSGLAVLGFFVWYIVLLHQVRGAVDGYLRRL